MTGDAEGYGYRYVKGAKSYHGTSHRRMPEPHRSQVRVLLRAKSRAEARRHLLAVGIHVSDYEFKGWWTVGACGAGLSVVVQTPPGTVLYQPLDPEPAERGSWLPWELDWPERPAEPAVGGPSYRRTGRIGP